MKVRGLTMIFGALMGIALTSGGLVQAAAAAPPPSAGGDAAGAGGYYAPYPGSSDPGSSAASNAKSGITLMADSGTITAGKCKYKQSVDDPHVTSGDASVHGYWKKVSGTCPSKANVDVYLQAWWCDWLGCRWVTVASGSGDYYAGGGSGRRANARESCSSTARVVGWRGFVDVDLIGVGDPSGYTYSAIKNLSCSP